MRKLLCLWSCETAAILYYCNNMETDWVQLQQAVLDSQVIELTVNCFMFDIYPENTGYKVRSTT